MTVSAHRLVVKVGSSLLVEPTTGELRRGWLAGLCADIAGLTRDGEQVMVVSSGAIALGRRALGLRNGSLKLEESQAAAAVGQVRLAEAYAEIFAREKLVAAQVLLTAGDTEERKRYLNARATLRTLLVLGSVPVINENDTIATSEIRYGDNDRLAARVASMMEARRLILLSDVDGLYSSNPAYDAEAMHIPEVAAITPAIEQMAGVSISGMGRGGMRSKLAAAKIATAAGCEVLIAKGTVEHPISALGDGMRCTRLVARATGSAARKRWIAGALTSAGVLTIDPGAVCALRDGKSLLPAGVKAVAGEFERGDTVVIRDDAGQEVARGLVAYAAEDAVRICGCRSAEIETVLGYRGRDEIVHRDDLVMTDAVVRA